MFHRFSVGRQIKKLAVEHIIGLKRPGRRQHHAPFNVGDINSLQVYCRPMSGLHFIHRIGVHLYATNLGSFPGGINTQIIT